MSGYSSIWVKITHPEIELPLVKAQYNAEVILPEGLVFACAVAQESGYETPVKKMHALSQQFNEAIFMSVQTVVDFFLYSHWSDGKLVRGIQYCADDGWYELEGEAESWEIQLFNQEEKIRQLSYLELEHWARHSHLATEYAKAQADAAQIESLWSAQTLQKGCCYPMVTASELYVRVLQAMRLTNPYY